MPPSVFCLPLSYGSHNVQNNKLKQGGESKTHSLPKHTNKLLFLPTYIIPISLSQHNLKIFHYQTLQERKQIHTTHNIQENKKENKGARPYLAMVKPKFSRKYQKISNSRNYKLTSTPKIYHSKIQEPNTSKSPHLLPKNSNKYKRGRGK